MYNRELGITETFTEARRRLYQEKMDKNVRSYKLYKSFSYLYRIDLQLNQLTGFLESLETIDKNGGFVSSEVMNKLVNSVLDLLEENYTLMANELLYIQSKLVNEGAEGIRNYLIEFNKPIYVHESIKFIDGKAHIDGLDISDFYTFENKELADKYLPEGHTNDLNEVLFAVHSHYLSLCSQLVSTLKPFEKELKEENQDMINYYTVDPKFRSMSIRNEDGTMKRPSTLWFYKELTQ